MLYTRTYKTVCQWRQWWWSHAKNCVAEKRSTFWQSFWAFVACCRTKHESLHGQSSTCRQAPSSQHLQTNKQI